METKLIIILLYCCFLSFKINKEKQGNNGLYKVFDTSKTSDVVKVSFINRGNFGVTCLGKEIHFNHGSSINSKDSINLLFKDWIFIRSDNLSEQEQLIGNSTPELNMIFYDDSVKVEFISVYLNNITKEFIGLYSSLHGTLVPKDKALCNFFKNW